MIIRLRTQILPHHIRQVGTTPQAQMFVMQRVLSLSGSPAWPPLGASAGQAAVIPYQVLYSAF